MLQKIVEDAARNDIDIFYCTLGPAFNEFSYNEQICLQPNYWLQPLVTRQVALLIVSPAFNQI